MKNVGFQLGKKKTKAQEKEQALDRISAIETFDGTTTIEGGGWFGSTLNSFSGNQDESQSVVQYRNMSLFPELDMAIDEISNAAIVPGTDLKPVKIDMSTCKVSDTIKVKVIREFDNILRLYDFNHKGNEVFRRWYIDSKLYYNLLIDKTRPQLGIQEIIPLDPLKIKKVREIKKEMATDGGSVPVQLVKQMDEYFLYTNTDKTSYVVTAAQGIKLSTDSVIYVPSGLVDLNSKRVIGYLNKAIRPLNMLRQMEDALLVYRIARAPERRVFYIDVGNLAKQKAEQYMKDMMSRFRTDITYNQSTGQIRDNRHHMSVLEDFWLPRKEGSRGTEIQTLQGAASTSQIEDVKLFEQKLYHALNVPVSRLTSESSGFNMGRSTEITREEIKFYKFVEQIRYRFAKLFYDTLRVQLILKGILTDDDWQALKTEIKFIFNTDNYFWDLKEAEIFTERLKILSFAEPYIGRFFSTDYIKKEILRQTPEMIRGMEQEMTVDRTRMAEEQAAMYAQEQARADADMQRQMEADAQSEAQSAKIEASKPKPKAKKK